MMPRQYTGGNGGSGLLLGCTCFNSPEIAVKSENQKCFNREGGRGKVRVIGFMGPSGRPCVPGAEIALQQELTVISSDSSKPSNLPKPACIK